MTDPTSAEVTACQHVLRGELPPGADLTLRYTLDDPEFIASGLVLSRQLCPYCAGLVHGALLHADTLRPAHHATVKMTASVVAALLHGNGCEPSLELGLALMRIGGQMIRELGAREPAGAVASERSP